MAKKKKRGPAKRNKKKTSKYFSASDRDKKGGSLPPCLPASLPPCLHPDPDPLIPARQNAPNSVPSYVLLRYR